MPLGRVGARLLVEGSEEPGRAENAPRAHRHEEARFREGLRDGDGLEQTRLAAGVRARDEDDRSGRRAHVAGDRMNTGSEEQRIEEALESHGAGAGVLGPHGRATVDELGQGHRQPLGRCTVPQAKAREVRLDVAEKLKE